MPNKSLSMHVIAALLDPSDNGFDISDLSVLLGIILLISGTTATIVRWNAKRVALVRTRERAEMEERIKNAVTSATTQIQPEYRNNGGSMRDIADKIDVVIERQSYISDRLDKHLDAHLALEWGQGD